MLSLIKFCSSVGQNLYVNSVEVNTDRPVSAWWEEIEYYTYSTGACQPNQMCGHYTQVMFILQLGAFHLETRPFFGF